MKYISASLITPHALAWLEHTCRAQVLHVFERACNLINEQGEVLSLVTQEVEPGPFAIVVNRIDPGFSQYVTIDTPVYVQPGHVILGDLTMDGQQAQIWTPCPDWVTLHTNIDDIILQIPDLSKWIQERAPVNSLVELLPLLDCHRSNEARPAQYATHFILAALEPARTLCEGLVANNLDACNMGAHSLAGLGAGLTPAGDDFLLGAMYAAWIIHPPEMASSIVETIVDSAVLLTTSLSAAWMKAAARGEAGAMWHSFLTTLLSAEKPAVYEAANHLLAVGYTSGADALAGFVASLDHYAAFTMSN